MFIARTHARTHAIGSVVCFRSEEHAEPGLVVMSPQGWAYVQADCKGKPRGDGFMQIEQVTVGIPYTRAERPCLSYPATARLIRLASLGSASAVRPSNQAEQRRLHFEL